MLRSQRSRRIVYISIYTCFTLEAVSLREALVVGPDVLHYLDDGEGRARQDALLLLRFVYIPTGV